MDILINDYINGERSLCRDEAQFSAYLFQILNGCKRVKIDSDNFTNKTYEVMQAYYMPAFLRDYFNYADSKAEFNRKLVTFANRKLRALYAGEEAQGAMLEDVDAKAVNAAEIYNLDKELDSEDYDSLGGFIIEHLDRLPVAGDEVITEDGIRLIVEKLDKNRIEKVHVYLPEKDPETLDNTES